MIHGILLVKKKINMTSYEVVKFLKQKFKVKKIGHAGTLDPFASGLLIVGINEGTKILPYFENEVKEYVAILTLGKLTDTYDKTGKVIKKKKISKHSKKEIKNVLNSFKKKYLQIPPIYSALKINGKHLYEYARKNIKVDINKKIREQKIYNIKLIYNNLKNICFQVKCNKGTYIRSLGVDIASKLHELGFLSYLKRIRIGKYELHDAKSIFKINEKDIIDIVKAVNIKKIQCKNNINKIKNGMPIKLKIKNKLILIVDKNNSALAIYELKEQNTYYCKRCFYYENF